MRKNKGARNLVIMVCGAILVAVMATGMSLFVYHVSGDIYLDRSRPGFLPDEEEAANTENVQDDYTFSENGEINKDILEEYLREFNDVVQRVDQVDEAFGAGPLTDESLGIEITED